MISVEVLNASAPNTPTSLKLELENSTVGTGSNAVPLLSTSISSHGSIPCGCWSIIWKCT